MGGAIRSKSLWFTGLEQSYQTSMQHKAQRWASHTLNSWALSHRYWFDTTGAHICWLTTLGAAREKEFTSHKTFLLVGCQELAPLSAQLCFLLLLPPLPCKLKPALSGSLPTPPGPPAAPGAPSHCNACWHHLELLREQPAQCFTADVAIWTLPH